MNEQDSILLDDYFNGLLTPEARQAVGERVETDPTFAEEFNLRQQMEDWPRREARRQALAGTLGTIGGGFFAQSSTGQQPRRRLTVQVNWQRWLLAAASIAILALAVWFMSSPEPATYRQYAHYAPLALTERGTAASVASEAETAFNSDDYPQALTALDRLLAEQPGNSVARLYRGLCLLELNRPVEARSTLEPLAQGQSVLRADAIWYSALSYLLENNPEGCRQILARLSAGDDHYAQSRELLKKLK